MKPLPLLVLVAASLAGSSAHAGLPKNAKVVTSVKAGQAKAIKRYQKYFGHSKRALRNGAVPPYVQLAQVRAQVIALVGVGARVGVGKVVSKGMVQHQLVASGEFGSGLALQAGVFAGVARLSLNESGSAMPIMEEVLLVSGSVGPGFSLEKTESDLTQKGQAQHIGLGLGLGIMKMHRANLAVSLHPPTASPLLKLMDRGAQTAEATLGHMQRGEHSAANRGLKTMKQLRSKIKQERASLPDFSALAD